MTKVPHPLVQEYHPLMYSLLYSCSHWLPAQVVALRRRTELTAAEVAEGVLDRLYSPAQLNELMAVSDYVVMATPHTPQTDKVHQPHCALLPEDCAAMRAGCVLPGRSICC